MTEFAQKYGQWAVIGGASEGIGASLADQLAARGLNLVLIARNGPLLEEVAARARDEATHKGVTIQFGGGPHPVDWYGTLDAVVDGRLDPLPSIGKAIGLDEVPDAIDQARKSQGPPRVVVHPTGEA
jgi:NAD(P)-dependent dehydrogenase (short-subunit alcohol dehydrogenase family)